MSVDGFIDMASLTEVANSFSGKMRDSYYWAAVAGVEVSCALVGGDRLKLLPSPRNRKLEAKGTHGQLVGLVSEYVDSTSPPAPVRDEHLAATTKWALDNTEHLRGRIELIFEDASKVYGPGCGFEQWISTALGKNLENTALRVGGLFERSFIPPIADVLQLSRTDLDRIWLECTDPRVIADIERNGDGSRESFAVARRAYLLSILLRGRYHDYVARTTRMQVFHHPVREPVLPKLEGSVLVPHQVTNTERFMAQLLWATAFSERTHEKRIALWAENVRLVRAAVQSEVFDLPQRQNEERALSLAVDSAKKAGVRAHPKLIDDAIDLSVAMGIGALGSFVVSGWPDLVITLATYLAAKRQALGDRSSSLIFERPRRLKNMAEIPGRIVRRYGAP